MSNMPETDRMFANYTIQSTQNPWWTTRCDYNTFAAVCCQTDMVSCARTQPNAVADKAFRKTDRQVDMLTFGGRCSFRLRQSLFFCNSWLIHLQSLHLNRTAVCVQ